MFAFVTLGHGRHSPLSNKRRNKQALVIELRSDTNEAVLPIRIRIRIYRIRMFLGLPYPNSDPLVRGMDPDPDPSIIKQK